MRDAVVVLTVLYLVVCAIWVVNNLEGCTSIFSKKFTVVGVMSHVVPVLTWAWSLDSALILAKLIIILGSITLLGMIVKWVVKIERALNAPTQGDTNLIIGSLRP